MEEPTGAQARRDPLSMTPPDDSGSDAFARFRYQAYVALPFALNCGMGGDVRSVVLEHFEDIAVEYADRWQFIQVKTRDSGLRRWRMSDLCGAGGGLRALLRSFRAVGPIGASHELWLEGGLERGNSAERLVEPDGRADPAIQADVAGRLGIDQGECAAFLARLKVKTNLPGRPDIGARIFRLLTSQAPRLPTPEVQRIENELVDLLCRAMAAELTIGNEWPSAILRVSATPGVDAKVDAKRLTPGTLRPVIEPLTHEPQPLLRRYLETELPAATALEEKLLAGGAPASLIRDAKQLRYQASLHEATRAASTLYDDDALLEDVRSRLQLRAGAVLAAAATDDRPATRMWLGLVEILATQAHQIDSNSLFSQDPDLLLGEVCEMSDLCQVEWGIARA